MPGPDEDRGHGAEPLRQRPPSRATSSRTGRCRARSGAPPGPAPRPRRASTSIRPMSRPSPQYAAKSAARIPGPRPAPPRSARFVRLAGPRTEARHAQREAQRRRPRADERLPARVLRGRPERIGAGKSSKARACTAAPPAARRRRATAYVREGAGVVEEDGDGASRLHDRGLGVTRLRRRGCRCAAVRGAHGVGDAGKQRRAAAAEPAITKNASPPRRAQFPRVAPAQGRPLILRGHLRCEPPVSTGGAACQRRRREFESSPAHREQRAGADARGARLRGGAAPPLRPERQACWRRARRARTASARASCRTSWRRPAASARASGTSRPPPDLQDRRVEITGPVERKMMINALNSGANVFMADFEDAISPTWENVVAGPGQPAGRRAPARSASPARRARNTR